MFLKTFFRTPRKMLDYMAAARLRELSNGSTISHPVNDTVTCETVRDPLSKPKQTETKFIIYYDLLIDSAYVSTKILRENQNICYTDFIYTYFFTNIFFLIKGNDLCGACGTHEAEDIYKSYLRKPGRKSALGRPSLRYGNITTDLKEVEWECME